MSLSQTSTCSVVQSPWYSRMSNCSFQCGFRERFTTWQAGREAGRGGVTCEECREIGVSDYLALSLLPAQFELAVRVTETWDREKVDSNVRGKPHPQPRPPTIVVHGRKVRALQQMDGQDTVPFLYGLRYCTLPLLRLHRDNISVTILGSDGASYCVTIYSNMHSQQSIIIAEPTSCSHG